MSTTVSRSSDGNTHDSHNTEAGYSMVLSIAMCPDFAVSAMHPIFPFQARRGGWTAIMWEANNGGDTTQLERLIAEHCDVHAVDSRVSS